MQSVSYTEALSVWSSASCLQCLGHFLLCHYCAIEKGFYPHLLRKGVQFTEMLMPHGSEFTQEACGRAEASRKIAQDAKKPQHMKGPWHNQSCMAMELLPERKEPWEDCRACHSLFCGRGKRCGSLLMAVQGVRAKLRPWFLISISFACISSSSAKRRC